MSAENTLSLVRKHALIPVIRAESAKEALRALDALHQGGIRVFEITLTTPDALEAVETARRHYLKDPEVLVGVGTVVSLVDAKESVKAGAQFVITPGLDLSVIEHVKENQTAMISGALTPTEVMAAWRAGADAIKIFPCANLGGVSYLKALRAPFPQIPFLPTGGVSDKNAAEFLNAGALALGVGGNLVDIKRLRSEGPKALTALAKKYLEAISSAKK